MQIRRIRTAALLILLIASATVPLHGEAQLPLAFEANEGQWNDEIRFLARGRAGMVSLEERGAVLMPAGPDIETIRMDIVGGSREPLIEGIDPLAHRTNYFIGGDPAEWRNNVPSYRRVLYRDVYSGIDAVFHSGPSGELEYDFIVHPGSDPRAIRLRFGGAEGVEIDEGELVIRTAGDPIRMMRPVAWQTSDGNRDEVAVRYRMIGESIVGFVVGEYDRSRELVIDPVVLGYSTFLGGTNDEAAFGIAVDVDRNTYIVGTTQSPDFPSRGGVQSSITGGRDVFVAKLNPAGDQILFSTFLGGSGDEAVRAVVAIDSRGDVYVTGSTSSVDFPVTEGAPQQVFGGGASDAFVTKLSSDGSRLLFSTYLGGEAQDNALAVAVDPLRNVYVAGRTRSGAFPVTDGALQTSRRGPRDSFVAKLQSDPPSLVFATYLGGSDEEGLLGLAVDAAGNSYITGHTLSTDYPITEGAFQTSFAGAGTGGQRLGDVFVSKIDPNGSALVYSTFFGGLSGEFAFAVAVDSIGAAYLTGLTYSTNFPTTVGSFQPEHGGGDADTFVTKLAPEGDRMVFSTFFGGDDSEQANALAVDRLGNIHVTGNTSSADFPTTADAVSRTRTGRDDVFVSIFARDGSELLYSTFLGGSAPATGPQDGLWGIAVDNAGNTYVAGQARSVDFPVTPGAAQTTHRGLGDATVTKFAVQREEPGGERRVIPVVGSTPGALGSFFRTSFQLHNPHAETISGRFVFHPQGHSGSDADPLFDYFLAPGETIAISDLLPAMSQSGLGSVDLLTPDGEMPESVVRIFNDAGEAGTTGMSQEPVGEAEALHAGVTGVLIAPASTARSRFNIGIRTLRDGASLAITVRGSDGTVTHTTTKMWPPDFFEQRSATDLLGTTLEADDTIALRVDAGSAVVYGSTTDNITQDPSLQLARAIDSVSGEMRILPVIGSTPGALGSFFKTGVQLHNPGTTAIRGRIVYHVQGVSGSMADPSLTYVLEPGQTVSWDDLLPAISLSGLGSADIISEEGPLPLSVVRIFNDAGERGTTGMTEDQVALGDALAAGDKGILIAPPDPAKARFNIGIRTLSEGATITATVRTSVGTAVKSVTKSFSPVFFTQTPASALVEMELQGSDTILLEVESGSAILYGATTDNISQDPMIKVVRRLQ